jgi:putative selenate reductase
MKLIPFNKLLNFIYEEFKNSKSIFGIPEVAFYKKENKNYYSIFNRNIDAPVGVAAGPNSQLSQNIIASYLVGARFIELKTVQVMDSLEINKPCIFIPDEGYNAEWSTELSLDEAFDEYLKAWITLHFLDLILPLNQINFPSFAFNMSVGYTFEGIMTKKMQNFIDKMLDATKSELFYKYIDQAITFINNKNLQIFRKEIDKACMIERIKNIRNKLVHSITLSTMHGTKPEEIGKIATHLLKDKKINTYVKLNPTLIGFNKVQSILNILGYDYISLDEENFKKDLPFDHALDLIKNLKKVAKENEVYFGVKLTNTLACINKENYLLDKFIYLSGKPLFPIAINVATALAEAFHGNLDISFSGGVDLYNVDKVYSAGISPITVATFLLKPSGYLKFKNLASAVEAVAEANNKNVIDLNKLKTLAEKALSDNYYKKDKAIFKRNKIKENLHIFDCFVSPCTKKCPFEQNVPEYLYNIEKGVYDKALDIIYLKNPLPAITGSICDHKCMFNCNRIDLDETLHIRGLKYCAVEKATFRPVRLSSSCNNAKVAIVGAGPAGLSASYYLALFGAKVTLFEKTSSLGGVPKQILPSFRLKESDINRDVKNILSLGVEVNLNANTDKLSINELRGQEYNYIIYAIGAGIDRKLLIKNERKGQIKCALEFLKEYKEGRLKDLGKRVVVVGGGNTAVDSARAALRIKGVESVVVLYRRSFYEMPADLEEYENAVKEGVKYLFLTNPVELINANTIRCQKMALGEKGEDGRRIFIPLDETIDIEADLLITAIGETVDVKYLQKCGLPLDVKGKINVDEYFQTEEKNVYLIGDSALGPSTIADSIATAKKACTSILEKEGFSFTKHVDKLINEEHIKIANEFLNINSVAKLTKRKTNIVKTNLNGLPYGVEKDSERCLHCSVECLRCVDVCPNRANVAINVDNLNNFNNKRQILHIDDYCNECGNCATFCPFEGHPYKDKFTYFTSEEKLKVSKNSGFCIKDIGSRQFLLKLNNNIYDLSLNDSSSLDISNKMLTDSYSLILTLFDRYKHIL